MSVLDIARHVVPAAVYLTMLLRRVQAQLHSPYKEAVPSMVEGGNIARRKRWPQGHPPTISPAAADRLHAYEYMAYLQASGRGKLRDDY